MMSLRPRLRYIYAKTCSSVGSVGSICKDSCFVRFILEKVNQHSPQLNQQRDSMNQQFFMSYTVLRC